MTGALAGLLLGAGLVFLLSTRWRWAGLADRVGPYLGLPLVPGDLAAGQGATIPFTRKLAAAADRTVGGSASVRVRLERAGSPYTVERFREQQVAWAAAGFVVGAFLLGLRLSGGPGIPPLSLVGLTVLLTAAGWLVRDRALTRTVRRREADMAAQLPAMAELMSLAVTAGEAPAGALERVARITGGPLADELRRALADTRAGATLTDSLHGMAERTGLPALARFVEGMRVAIARGTPLAEVLHAQAGDAREAGKRALLEAGGRKDLAMLVPVVFLILPVTIVFALFPGAVALTALAH